MSEKKRLINDLRVIDLRGELEKRKLDKNGVRAVLLKRLSQFLKGEGEDPETYTFEPLAAEPKTPSKRGRNDSSLDADTEDALLEDVRVEDMIVQDDVGDEDDLEDEKPKDKKNQAPAPEETKPSTEAKEVAMETDTAEKEQSETAASRKREIKEETEATEAKRPCVEPEKSVSSVPDVVPVAVAPAAATTAEPTAAKAPTATATPTVAATPTIAATPTAAETSTATPVKSGGKAEEEAKDLNNTDAEDSINLDIGEDELLNDDADSTAKTRKDGSEVGASATAPAASGADDAAGATGDAASKEDVQVKSDGNTTSETADDKKDKNDKDAKVEGEGSEGKDRKEEGKDGGGGSAARNLWVSGLSGDTRAKDLKQLCSKHGKVIGAKVVTNARTPGSRCYGYVTMASAQDAESCIKNLHRTELHGRMISVEKAKSEAGAVGAGSAPSRRSSAPSHRSERREPHAAKERASSKEPVKDENGLEPKKDGEEAADVNAKAEGEEGEEKARSTSRSREKSKGAAERARRERSRERRRSPREVLSFSKILKERDVARARERSRQAREEERRRRAAEEVLRERERRQRQEKHRLAVEREKLRDERERIEREKNELLRLERERHKLEREKLELERLELKRAQLRLEEERRKRSYDSGPGYRKPSSPPPPPTYERDVRHKRPAPQPLSSARGAFEAPPPPRFEVATPAYERAAAADKRERADYKREYNPRHISCELSIATSGRMQSSARGAFEAPPPPRFEVATPAYERAAAADKRERADYKREYNPRHISCELSIATSGRLQSSARGAFEAPPPPRFEVATPAYERAAAADKRERADYKREYNPRHISCELSIATSGRLQSSARGAFEAPPPPRFKVATPAYERAAADKRERADYKREYNPRHISCELSIATSGRMQSSARGAFEAPPPPRFEVATPAYERAAAADKRERADYKREYNPRHISCELSIATSGRLQSSARGAFEAPPPPRFEVATPAYERAAAADKRERADYKREYNPRHISCELSIATSGRLQSSARGAFEAPPPPRFEVATPAYERAAAADKRERADYKREYNPRHISCELSIATSGRLQSSARGAFEAPPPPRFEVATPAYERAAAADKRERADYKREYNPRHISSSSVKYPSNGTSADDARQPVPPGTRPKEPSRGGYEPRESRGTYRSPPPSKPEPRSWAASRYPDSSAPTKEYSERSGGSSWQSSGAKSYPSSRHAAAAAPAAQSWTKPGSSSSTGEAWQSSSGGGGGGGESRYSSSYEPRSYPASYQPPPPGAAPYVDRYPAAARSHYTQKY